MTRPAKVALALAAVAVVVLYATYPWKRQPERGSREWQIQQFRSDLKACSEFASKREEARKLLAWKPKPPWANKPGTDAWKKEFEDRMRQQAEEAQANLRNLLADIPAKVERFQADENACLQDLDWPEEQIVSLRKEVSQPPKNKLLR
jgi:hypothetical protein